MCRFFDKGDVMDTKKRERVEILDLLRGIAMILVIMYHILYDLKFIYGKDIPSFLTPGNHGFEIFHTGFLWVLFAVSGICAGYSRNSLKRGALLYILGWGITAATSIFMPSELIVFGVISCFGACMVITALIKPFLDKIPWQGLLAFALVMWIVFRNFHRGSIWLIFTEINIPRLTGLDYLYPIGIRSDTFRSADYFPIIPYYFMFLAGNALYRPISEHKLPGWFYRIRSGAVGFIGRHSLIIYAVHQPLLLILFELVF